VLNHIQSAIAARHSVRVHSYVIDHDLGFAPNPFHGVCTLAACKPEIRRCAQIGDYIIGTGSRPSGRQGHLIYWMRVDEILNFDQYWSDPRFHRKRPVMRGSLMLRYGDNIYHHVDGSETFAQEDSFHSEPNGVTSVENLDRDTKRTDRVLIGREFAYWGGEGPKIPAELIEFVHKTQGHKNRFAPERIDAFITWVRGLADSGWVADPTDWPD
jgi:hypothetical protein